jgi:predicted membrane protein
LASYVKNFVDGLNEQAEFNSDFEIVSLKNRDGIDLSAYVMGNGPSTIVLVNAVGMTPEIILPLREFCLRAIASLHGICACLCMRHNPIISTSQRQHI